MMKRNREEKEEYCGHSQEPEYLEGWDRTIGRRESGRERERKRESCRSPFTYGTIFHGLYLLGPSS